MTWLCQIWFQKLVVFPSKLTFLLSENDKNSCEILSIKNHKKSSLKTHPGHYLLFLDFFTVLFNSLALFFWKPLRNLMAFTLLFFLLWITFTSFFICFLPFLLFLFLYIFALRRIILLITLGLKLKISTDFNLRLWLIFRPFFHFFRIVIKCFSLAREWPWIFLQLGICLERFPIF